MKKINGAHVPVLHTWGLDAWVCSTRQGALRGISALQAAARRWCTAGASANF